MSIKLLLEENLSALGKFSSIITNISDDQFCFFDPSLFPSSVGQHTRHVIDHYEMFLEGYPTQVINYDARGRESAIEINRTAAIERIKTIIEKLSCVEPSSQMLNVVMDMRGSSDQDAQSHSEITKAFQPSSMAREFSFLHSHATHHYAVLAIMFRFLNLATDIEDLAFAPATLRHMRALKCAP